MRLKQLGIIAGLLIALGAGVVPVGWAADGGSGNADLLSKVSFYKADLAAVLQQLAAECGYNIVMTPEVQGTVTFQFQQVTFDEVLHYLMQSQGLSAERNGRNILVGKTGQLQSEKNNVSFFPVVYAEPLKAAEILKQVVPETEIVPDERTRTILVRGSQASLERAGAVLKSLDRKMDQITIEAKVVEVSVTALRRLGVEWQSADSTLDWGLTTSGAELILNLIQGGKSWNMILDCLMSQGNARLVTAPSVATLDGKAASILIGDKVPLEMKDKDGNITVQYQEVGVKLSFTPWVQQTGEIRIELATQVNSLGEKIGNYYTINAREVTSKLQAGIGETIFIGGLITNEERNTLLKLPLVGDIPLLGKLFQHTEKTRDESELIVTITPRWTHSVQLSHSATEANPEVKLNQP